MRYMISIDSINAILVAEYFVRYVFKLYRLPSSIISNRGNCKGAKRLQSRFKGMI